MDITVSTSDTDAVTIVEVREALERADFFVATVTIVDRDGNVVDTDA